MVRIYAAGAKTFGWMGDQLWNAAEWCIAQKRKLHAKRELLKHNGSFLGHQPPNNDNRGGK